MGEELNGYGEGKDRVWPYPPHRHPDILVT